MVPAGYNTNICNFGDIGVSKIYFIIDKNIAGI
jgi:hypothetical protein